MRKWFRYQKSIWTDPVGWDPVAKRMHDLEPGPYGLLHYSTCWCRKER